MIGWYIAAGILGLILLLLLLPVAGMFSFVALKSIPPALFGAISAVLP